MSLIPLVVQSRLKKQTAGLMIRRRDTWFICYVGLNAADPLNIWPVF